MRIITLQASNFKKLVAVEITPEGNLVEVTGKNGAGKSSVLDAIYVALVGRSAAPPKPIRQGEEQCRIRLDMGDLIVTRTFTAKDGGSFTDTLKVENAEGLRYGKPQEVLDALLGEIGFDPFEFVQMKAVEQAETLLRMVPLSVDLDELAEQDASDYLKRRDVNRDLAAAKSQLAGIPKEDVPEELPDREALMKQLTRATEHNMDASREQLRREREKERLEGMRRESEAHLQRAADWREQAKRAEEVAAALVTDVTTGEEALKALAPVPPFVDAEALSEQIAVADRIYETVSRQRVRAEREKAAAALEAESTRLTEAMQLREKQRNAALAGAKMPIDGLGFVVDEKGKPLVTFGGVPFEQASTAEQLRASTAIAMAANPSLRVLRIKDGSLLDEDSLKLLGDMAKAEDFQLWLEKVGTGGVGIVMENGEVAEAAPAKTKAKVKDEKPEGALV